MDLPFRIEERERFRVAGYRIQTTNRGGEARKAVPSFWARFHEEHLGKAFMELSGEEPKGLFGVNVYNTDEADSRKFEYLIAVPSDGDVPEGLTAYTVPAMTWAVFSCTPETVGKTEVMAITKWLPKSKYRPLNKGYITGRMKAGAPDLEYYRRDGGAEVWVAVREKG